MTYDVAVDHDALPSQKILWQGPLFGRLTKAGKQRLLHRKGWMEIQQPPTEYPDDNETRLALIWPNKSGPQFEIDDEKAAHIRPYPKHVTDVLDDKVRLRKLLQHTEIMPPHTASPDEADPDKLYFVKHRFGAQGKSVYCLNHDELQEWWGRTSNPQDFAVQEEIMPELYRGRKFAMRSHILMWHSNTSTAAKENGTPFRCHLFDDVIVQHHAVLYDATSNKASQISNVGKNHPTPVLLKDLPSDHPAVDIYPQLVKACEGVLTLFETHFNEEMGFQQALRGSESAAVAPETTCFALLGLDWLLQAKGNDDTRPRVKLCEINSHPALGWGTMAKVPSKVYTDLVQQTLDLLIDASKVGFKKF